MQKTSSQILAGQQANIYYEVQGQGPTWVFIHGYLENVKMWDVLPNLKSIQTIKIDLPGHGKSDEFSSDYTLVDIASCIIRILQEEEIDNFNLVGHSMGAYVCLEILASAIDKVNSITIFESTSFADSEEVKLKRSRLIRLMEQDKNVDISASVKNLFAPSFEDTEIIERQLEESKKTSWFGIMKSTQAMRDRRNHFETLKTFSGEIHYYIGEKDNIFDFLKSEKEAKAVGANYIIDREAGHMAHLENPKSVIQFFKSILLVD